MSFFNRQRHSKCFLNFLGKCFPEAKGSAPVWFTPSTAGTAPSQPRSGTGRAWGDGAWQLLSAVAKNQEELQKRKKKITQIPLIHILYFELISIFPFPHPILHTHSAALLGLESYFDFFFFKCFTSYTIFTSHYSPISTSEDS